MEKYKISLDPTDHTTQVVNCTKRDMFMRVLKKPEVISPDMLGLTFTLYEQGIQSYDYVFEIMYLDLDRGFKNWDMQLFQEAVVYYCVQIFGAEPDGISLINQHNFYPYETGEVIY